jgi:hypothetical protein
MIQAAIHLMELTLYIASLPAVPDEVRQTNRMIPANPSIR